LSPPEFEVAVDRFHEAQQHYLELEERFRTGSYLEELLSQRESISSEWLIRQHQELYASLMEAVERRNIRLQEAQAALRGAIDQTTLRGPDSRSQVVNYRGFKVESRTSRSFDIGLLHQALSEKSKDSWERLCELTAFTTDGEEFKVLSAVWQINFQHALSWLKEQGHQDIVAQTYKEEAGTPAITGPKEVVFGELRRAR
jgi:hypothetical protein